MKAHPSHDGLQAAAAGLTGWFADIVRLWSSACFDWSTSPEHRDAAILETLCRNAKVILDAPIDSKGDLYKPLTIALTAACRRHGVVPSERHWLAALRNVQELRRRVASADAEQFALPIGTPASIFKDLFCEALVHAGVTDRPTILVEDNRRASLGLAINWGLRFLLAYAAEMRPPRSHGRAREVHDLRWVHSLIATGPESAQLRQRASRS
jgi:hypothetical protein